MSQTPEDQSANTSGDTASEPLPPGAGSPLVPGPPQSVSPPIQARSINTVFGIGAILLILAVIVVVVILGIVVLGAVGHH